MRTWLIGMLAATLLVAAGCNTVEGVGKDVESGGDAISDTARSAKQAL